MSLTSDLIRGHTETIILAQLLKKDSYGYEINKSIQQTTHGEYELKEATLYSAFRRLENAEMIESYWGDETTGAWYITWVIFLIGAAVHPVVKVNIQ